MDKAYRLKCIDLAEAATKEIDAADTPEAKRDIVNWMNIFWNIAIGDLASYAVAKPDIKELVVKGITARFKTARDKA